MGRIRKKKIRHKATTTRTTMSMKMPEDMTPDCSETGADQSLALPAASTDLILQ
jgi:hypothetical protein